MPRVALVIRLEAKPGKEEDVAEFLRSGLGLVRQEPSTMSWFAIRFGPSSFGLFSAFPHEAGRQAHLDGTVVAAIKSRATELLTEFPQIEHVEVIAAKLL